MPSRHRVRSGWFRGAPRALANNVLGGGLFDFFSLLGQGLEAVQEQSGSGVISTLLQKRPELIISVCEQRIRINGFLEIPLRFRVTVRCPHDAPHLVVRLRRTWVDL